jgi:ribA/ribD-fused uncharacterized protein
MSHYIFFCSHKEGATYPQFSNWYPFEYLGQNDSDILNKRVYSSSEQQFMYLKAMYFQDPETAVKIMATNDAKQIKQLGREIKNYDDKEWEKVRRDKMKICLKDKFNNFDLAMILLSTKDKMIVEAASYDRIYGCGFDADNAIENRNKWGLNLLGELLMEIRGELKVKVRNNVNVFDNY